MARRVSQVRPVARDGFHREVCETWEQATLRKAQLQLEDRRNWVYISQDAQGRPVVFVEPRKRGR